MKHPKFDLNSLDENDRHLIHNYYYEYLNKFNELSDKIPSDFTETHEYIE